MFTYMYVHIYIYIYIYIWPIWKLFVDFLSLNAIGFALWTYILLPGHGTIIMSKKFYIDAIKLSNI